MRVDSRHTMRGLERARELSDSGSALTISSSNLSDFSGYYVSSACDNLVSNGVRPV